MKRLMGHLHFYCRGLSGVFGLLDLKNGKSHIVAKYFNLELWPTLPYIPSLGTMGYAVCEIEGRENSEIGPLSSDNNDDDDIRKSCCHRHSLNG